ncbi:hypothetical protein JCM30471_35630 [Desulfuromonas carbonis]
MVVVPAGGDGAEQADPKHEDAQQLIAPDKAGGEEVALHDLQGGKDEERTEEQDQEGILQAPPAMIELDEKFRQGSVHGNQRPGGHRPGYG